CSAPPSALICVDYYWSVSKAPRWTTMCCQHVLTSTTRTSNCRTLLPQSSGRRCASVSSRSLMGKLSATGCTRWHSEAWTARARRAALGDTPEGAEAHEGPHCLYVTLVIDTAAAAEVSWLWLSSIGPDDTTDKGDMQRCGARRNWTITLD